MVEDDNKGMVMSYVFERDSFVRKAKIDGHKNGIFLKPLSFVVRVFRGACCDAGHECWWRGLLRICVSFSYPRRLNQCRDICGHNSMK